MEPMIVTLEPKAQPVQWNGGRDNLAQSGNRAFRLVPGMVVFDAGW